MAKKERKTDFRGGYSKVLYSFNAFFNFLLALILIICSTPLLLIISLIIKLQDGGHVFYKGVRLGHNKKPFTMYKFRTLVPDAERIIGAEVLTSKHKVVTPFGRSLRNTRLDELPQLFNILKGDMDFVGPRPQRRIIYEKFCKQIRGYDKRFLVRPGLIGYAQLFIPHSSPKRIQASTDYKFLEKKQKFFWELSIVLYTIIVVTKTVLLKMLRYLWNDILRSKILGIYNEKRYLDRVRTERAKVYIGSKIGDKEIFTDEAELVDINEDAFLICTNHKINQNDLVFKMEVVFNTQGYKRSKTKHAICTGNVYREFKTKDSQFKYSYVIRYTPISPLNSYMVHQYFLLESMV